MLRALGYLWSTPTVLLVMPLLLVLWALRQVDPYALDHWQARRGTALERWMGWRAAMTLGWVVVWRDTFWLSARLRQHEQRHIEQSLVLGPFYLPVYLMLLVWCGYAEHPMERAARGEP